MFYASEKIALFVDGRNTHATARNLALDIDYRLLLDLFRKKGRLLRASYFTPIHDEGEHAVLRPLVDWLQYNGWHVITQTVKTYEDDQGQRRSKGSTDMDLAMAAVKLAPSIDHAVLFSGSRYFTPLVAYLQECGVRVSVVSSIRTNPGMIADELRRQADAFIELEDLRLAIAQTTSSQTAA